jgi:hypothetical protein
LLQQSPCGCSGMLRANREISRPHRKHRQTVTAPASGVLQVHLLLRSTGLPTNLMLIKVPSPRVAFRAAIRDRAAARDCSEPMGKSPNRLPDAVAGSMGVPARFERVFVMSDCCLLLRLEWPPQTISAASPCNPFSDSRRAILALAALVRTASRPLTVSSLPGGM